MPRRVKRPSSHDELLNKLTDKEKGGIFETYKDVMLFAAALAAYNAEQKPLQGKSSEPIDYNIFSKKSDNEALIHLLAIYNRDDITILSDENSDERVKILEEYANAGLDIIDQKIRSSATTLDAILGLIQETGEKNKVKERDFSDIAKYFKDH